MPDNLAYSAQTTSCQRSQGSHRALGISRPLCLCPVPGVYGEPVLTWEVYSSSDTVSSSWVQDSMKASTRLSRCSALKAADWMMKATKCTVSTLHVDSHTCRAQHAQPPGHKQGPVLTLQMQQQEAERGGSLTM